MSNIRNRALYTNVFEYDFLRVGDEYEFLHEPEGVVMSGTLVEMLVSRSNEEDAWLTFRMENDGLIYDFPLSELAFDETHEESEEDNGHAYAVKFVKIYDQAKLPEYGSEGATGMDFFSPIMAVIMPGESLLVPTGLKIELPDGFDMKLSARSSQGKKGIIVANAPGIVDNDYRGHVQFALWNISKEMYVINVGDKIGQGHLAPVFRGTPLLVEELSETVRGEGGFGSTGR